MVITFNVIIFFSTREFFFIHSRSFLSVLFIIHFGFIFYHLYFHFIKIFNCTIQFHAVVSFIYNIFLFLWFLFFFVLLDTLFLFFPSLLFCFCFSWFDKILVLFLCFVTVMLGLFGKQMNRKIHLQLIFFLEFVFYNCL